jgi:hypothetical protein
VTVVTLDTGKGAGHDSVVALGPTLYEERGDRVVVGTELVAAHTPFRRFSKRANQTTDTF